MALRLAHDLQLGFLGGIDAKAAATRTDRVETSCWRTLTLEATQQRLCKDKQRLVQKLRKDSVLFLLRTYSNRMCDLVHLVLGCDMSLLHQAPIPSFSWDAQRIAAPAIDEVQALEFCGHLKILCRLGVRKKHAEEWKGAILTNFKKKYLQLGPGTNPCFYWWQASAEVVPGAELFQESWCTSHVWFCTI